MAELPQTSQAIYEYRARMERGFGSHLGEETAVGVPGIRVGEVAFDPARHSVDSIARLPRVGLGALDGLPQVNRVMPFRPVEMSVILHRDPRDNELPAYLAPIKDYKQRLGQQLLGALGDAKQLTDKVNLYVVGDTEGAHELGQGRAFGLKGTEAPEAAAEAIADICQRGLSFIISDFNRLPMDQVSGFRGGNTVAIKANHALELELPPKVGRITLGGLQEVNTNKPRELSKANDALAQRQQAIDAVLQATGMQVAPVVFTNDTLLGFDAREADRVIAPATRAATR